MLEGLNNMRESILPIYYNQRLKGRPTQTRQTVINLFFQWWI